MKDRIREIRVPCLRSASRAPDLIREIRVPCPVIRVPSNPRLQLALHFLYDAVQMGRTEALGEFEQIVLLAVVRLQQDAYGSTIRREIEERTERSIAIGALYTALDRLERKGYVNSSLSDPTPQRGGRAKRYFRLRPAGAAALRRSRDIMSRMWAGVDVDVQRSRG